MSINSIPSVSFGTKYGAMDKVSAEQMNSYGTYSQPMDSFEPQHKKKGGFGSFLGKLILTAAVVG